LRLLSVFASMLNNNQLIADYLASRKKLGTLLQPLFSAVRNIAAKTVQSMC